MLRMRTKLSVLTAAIVAAITSVNSAHAGIQITGQVVNIVNDSFTNGYVANDFVGVIISANVTTGSASIAGWDMSTNTGVAHGQLGISGSLGLAQYWARDSRGNPINNNTPNGDGSTSVPFANAIPSGSTDSNDSWLSPLSNLTTSIASGGNPLEDNNASAADAPNGTPANPMNDGVTGANGNAYGMGTFLRESITISNDLINSKPQPSSVPIAYVIVKRGSVVNVNTRIFDNLSTDFFLNVNIPTSVPEPASLILLTFALGGIFALRNRGTRKRIF